MRTRKKRRSRKRIGTSLVPFLAAVLVQASSGADKKAGPSYALVAGTVFQESGYALSGAAVTLAPDPQPDAPPPKGAKKIRSLSDSRGEFVFRVPAGPMRYTVQVDAKGFQSQEKSVEIQGEERADVTFQLQPQSK
jgi:hypothetical protein